jgi:small-conductance mechanosensitive channel
MSAVLQSFSELHRAAARYSKLGGLSASLTDRDRSSRLRIGFLTGLVLPSVILLSLALALFLIEVKLDVDIPHRTLTTTALWSTVGLAAIFIFSRSINSQNLPTIREEKVSTLRKTVVGLLSLTVIFGALARFGIDLSAYLIGLGVGAIIIGFAAQSTISNFISGTLVVMEKTINTGDYVRVNVPGAPVEGTIEEVSFLRTRIVTNDGVRVSVPNTLLLNTTVSNYTLSEERPLLVFLNIATDWDASRLKEDLGQATDAQLCPGQLSRVYIRSIDRDTVNVELWIKVSTSRYLSERDSVVQTVSKICRELGLTLNTLTTT